MSAIPKVARETPRVLIVGTGLTGSLTCYHLRASATEKSLPLRIDVADMARGPGGRMSTTRFGPDSIRANTGAQYLSTSSARAAALLQSACASSSSSACPLDRVADPLKRTTHFSQNPDDHYTHWLPRLGTNSAVRQFLYGGEPDLVVFESRLQRMAASSTSARLQLVPLFDSGGTKSAYDVVILAMPPKDIVKFFNSDKLDSQSQADLHRRTNRGTTPPLPSNHHGIVLPPDVLHKLRAPSYVGRYSLVLWFQDGTFADRAARAWSRQHGSHPVIDMVSSQDGGVLVAQSTVELWRRLNNSRGGGRGPAKTSMVVALECLAGGKMPRPENTKLLNWRTSQVVPPSGNGVVTAEGGRLIFTGDWCFESSFEGCNLAAEAAATAAVDKLCDTTEAASQELESRTNAVPGQHGNGGVGAAVAPTGRGGDRECSGPCGDSHPRSEYSKNQWSKPDGSSRCKQCVAGINPGSAADRKRAKKPRT